MKREKVIVKLSVIMFLLLFGISSFPTSSSACSIRNCEYAPIGDSYYNEARQSNSSRSRKSTSRSPQSDRGTYIIYSTPNGYGYVSESNSYNREVSSYPYYNYSNDRYYTGYSSDYYRTQSSSQRKSLQNYRLDPGFIERGVYGSWDSMICNPGHAARGVC